MEKVLVKDAIKTVLYFIQVFAIVGNLRIREKQGLLFYGNNVVGIIHIDITNHQHYFIKVPSFIG
jgi:hypothetical protein